MTRTNEVQIAIMKHGLERATVKLLVELFERIAACESNVQQMGVIQLQGLHQLAQVVDGAGALRQQVEQMQRTLRGGSDNDLPLASG